MPKSKDKQYNSRWDRCPDWREERSTITRGVVLWAIASIGVIMWLAAGWAQ